MTRLLGHRDVLAGVILAILGVAVTAYTAANYDLGMLRFVRPGAFPLGAGLLMALLGLAMALAGLRDATPPDDVQWPDLARVAGAIMAFALLIQPAGIVIAVAALTAITIGDRDAASWRNAGVVASLIVLLCIGLFQYGLGLRVTPIGEMF